MAKQLSRFLFIFFLFPITYLTSWVTYLLIVYLSERNTNFEAAEGFYLALYFVITAFLPFALFAHLVALVLKRKSFHRLSLWQTLSAGLVIGLISAIVPATIWLINLKVLRLRDDQATLWTGIFNLLVFAGNFGAPFVSTYFFANFFNSGSETKSLSDVG